ncbi:MAG: hypothetical protein KC583_02315, partial [Myxococcales bacterium]|nr:hypothetical protein [Myxococcales bacterium]
QTRATDFVARPDGLFHRFDAAVDWQVFALNDGVLDLVAEVPAASVRVDGYTRVGDLTVESIEQARTYVFARADRTLSPFARVGEDGVRSGRLADTGAGRVVQLRYPLPGVPFDTVDDYGFGPSSWENQYGAHRAFHPVRRDSGPGVVWQDVETNQVRVTWLSDADPAAVTHVALPTLDGARLAAAHAEADGGVTCLHIQRGDGRPNATRAVTLVKANAQGAETRRAALDAGPDAMNIVEFGDRDHATMTRSGDRLGIVVTRTMHRAPDGLNHQGGLALLVDADTLAVTGPMHWPGHPESPVGAIQTSSHAFANVLAPNGDGGFLGADLGDAAPRGVNLYRLTDAEMVTRVAFTFKTRHGTTPSAYPGGPTYPVYAEISSPGQTFYQWSNDNTTYTELGGVAKTDDGVVVLFSTERSLLDNSRLGALWNETRDLAMVRVRSDFARAAPGRDAVVTDDLVLSQGAPAVESKYYFFTGTEQPQRVAGVVFLTQLAADQSASRPHLHARGDGLLAVYEVWRTTRTPGMDGQPDTFADAYLDTRAVRLTTEGLPVMGSDSSLGAAVRLQNRDDPFTLAGGTALVAGDGEGRALVV